MSKQIFSAKALSAVVRAGDSRQFDVDLKGAGAAIIQAASDEALKGAINLANFKKTKLKGKECVSYKEYSTALLLRVLTRYYTRRLRVSLRARDRIVRGVIETLLDGTPVYAVRRDITSFYESVTVAPLRRKLLFEIPGSALIRNYLKAYFKAHCETSERGLPRGVGLSALLAEVSMREFDNKVRAIPGVYKYYRYSDDILIFSTRPSKDLDAAIGQALPAGMQFNGKKSSETLFPGKTKGPPTKQSLEYLGYNFTTHQLHDRDDSRVVRVSPSTRKLNKLKSRIVLSLLSHSKSPNWILLRDRCRFITCNFKVRRNGADVLKGGAHVYSGIYYNYKLSGNYSVKSGKLRAVPYDAAELKALDGFYHSIINLQIKHGKIVLSPAQIMRLKRFSFHKGYTLRIKGRFAADRVAFMKRAWRNV